MTIAIEPHDPFLWLEGIHDPDALAWASTQTEATLAEFASPRFDALTGRLLEVIDSDERIPVVSKRGDFYYNFWRDSSHPRGLWRRTTLDSYRSDSANPGSVDWDVLLDIDALGRAENTEWVFAGAKLLPHDKVPANEAGRALVSLSPDGGDAVTVREFDLDSREFVADGFIVPTAKTIISWIDRDTVYVGTDFGPGSMTTSSYARTARRWSRGQALAEAELVHEVAETDLEVVASHIHTPGFERDLVIEVLDFYRSRTLLQVDGEYVLLDLPEDADVDIRRDRLLVHPRSTFGVYPSGSLLSIPLDAFLAGDRDFASVFTPDAHSALESWDWTNDSLILTVLEDVASKLVRVTPPSSAADDAGWTHAEIEGLPTLSTLRLIDTDADHSNEFWVHATGFTTPATVLRGVLDETEPEVIKATPSLFDDARFTVEQHWAVSADGTRIPYFQVAETGLALDGSHPTLLSGYGGFQSSVLPDYSALVGRGWLERGGVYVRANIRGGGEFGPDWHTAALKQNRPRAYEDFAAVAKDLVARGVTSAARLGAEGRSNGGLLVGNMLTTYPELFGAIVCGVPLLDMRRYTKLSAGASWIAEYGDPDIAEEWEFIQTFSPYHLLREETEYPATLFYAATSDDRVGPVQARKMAALMQSMELPGIRYFENADGGHGGAVDNTHTARLQALIYEFLWSSLAP
ncbi:prolyl oligopeptidase family serine peptidase [soil metagenome]